MVGPLAQLPVGSGHVGEVLHVDGDQPVAGHRPEVLRPRMDVADVVGVGQGDLAGGPPVGVVVAAGDHHVAPAVAQQPGVLGEQQVQLHVHGRLVVPRRRERVRREARVGHVPAVVADLAVDAALPGLLVGCLQMGREGRDAVRVLPEGVPGQHQHDARGLRPYGREPQRVGPPHGLVTEPLAVRDDPDDLLFAVLAGLEAHLADAHLTDLEARRDLLQHLGVGVAAQHGQFGERLGDDPDVVGTVLLELHPAPAETQRQTPVDPVGAAPDVDPRQHLEQPARGDGLHLRHGLGGGGELARRPRAETGEPSLGRAGAGSGLGCGVVGGGADGAFGGGHIPSLGSNGMFAV